MHRFQQLQEKFTLGRFAALFPRTVDETTSNVHYPYSSRERVSPRTLLLQSDDRPLNVQRLTLEIVREQSVVTQ